MNDRNKYNKSSDFPVDPSGLFSGTVIRWDKNREQIWNEIERKLEPPHAKVRTMNIAWIKYAAAAAFMLLAGLVAVMQLYVKKITVPAGLHSEIILPDNSKVRLNAETNISFRPFKWNLSRKIYLEGEAFFEVEPGKKFEVVSALGTTVVMGTSFNIYSRDSVYEVSCLSGKVKVTGFIEKNGIIINPGEKVSIDQKGTLNEIVEIGTWEPVSWLENRLSFTSAPLKQVFEEISRQYNVTLHLPDNLDFVYTGTFRRDTAVEQALNAVCKPFDLNYSQGSENEYYISESKPAESF